MKKLLILLLAVVMLITVSGLSLASYEFPAKVYMLQGNNQWGDPVSCLGLHARAFVSDPASGMCDKKWWIEDLYCGASVSQWISYCFSGTNWDWEIRKPGIFSADCILFSIQSNDDVLVTCSGFDNLAPLVHPNADPIRVWYSVSDLMAIGPPQNWIAAPDLNGSYWLGYDQVSKGIIARIWNKIEILPTTRACNYGNKGYITLTLTDVKPFIDPCTGDYWY